MPDALEWDADFYQQHSTFQARLGHAAIERLAPRPGERVLEVGCGNGLLTLEVARRVVPGHVVAVEVSGSMVTKARENCTRHTVTNVDVVHADALDITYTAEFDAVFSNSAIHWIPDLETAYARLFRALKPGGRLLVQTGLRTPEVHVTGDTILEMIARAPFREYFADFQFPWRFCTAEENRALLRDAGFTRVRMERYPYVARFPSMEALNAYNQAATMVPLLSALPANFHPAFIEQFHATFARHNQHRTEIAWIRAFVGGEKTG